MREAIFRFSLNFSAVSNAISLASIREKFASYARGFWLGAKNQMGESEIASFLPSKSEPRAATFCMMLNAAIPGLPTGETWNPVGAVQKKLLAFWGCGSTSSELP